MTPFKTFRGFLSPVFRTGIAGIVQPGVGVEPNHVEMGGRDTQMEYIGGNMGSKRTLLISDVNIYIMLIYH
jgi:hypothetical protein